MNYVQEITHDFPVVCIVTKLQFMFIICHFLNNSSNSIIILQFFIVAKGALEGIMRVSDICDKCSCLFANNEKKTVPILLTTLHWTLSRHSQVNI